MKAARLAAILIALPIVFSCELFSGPNDRENPKDPLSPAYVGWYGVKAIDSTNDVGKYASIKVSGSNVFISYFDATGEHTRFAASTDGGLGWTSKRIDTSTLATGNPSALAIRPTGSTFDIVVVYKNGDDLHAKKSSNSGWAWADPATMQPDVASFVLPHCSLAAGTGADDRYYASYCVQGAFGGNLWLAKSSAGGGDWSAGTGADVNPTADVGRFNSIAVNGGKVFIAYQRGVGAGSEILVTNSNGGDPPWTPEPAGTTTAAALGGTAVAATDTLNVYVVYFDGTHLTFAKSSNGGGSFLAPSFVNSNAGISPSIAISAGKIYVSHFHGASGDLLFTRSDDFGATWIDPPMVVDAGLGTNMVGKSTSIAVDGTNVYIAYYDATNGDLKVAKSIDNGDTW